MDQVWYWQNVRPRLTGRRQSMSLFIQTLMGAIIVTLFLIPGIIAIETAVDSQIERWQWTLLGVLAIFLVVSGAGPSTAPWH